MNRPIVLPGIIMAERDFERRIVFFNLVGHAFSHQFLLLFPPLLLLMQEDLRVDMTSYYALANLFFGLGAFPAGALASRLGDKALLVLFFTGCALGAALIGYAQGPWLLGTGAVVLGLATSIYHPVGAALLSKGVSRLGMAMGINGVAGSLGTAMGPLYAFLIIQAAGLSWRWAFLSLAVPALLLGFLLWAMDLGPAASTHGTAAPSSGRQPLPRLPREKLLLYILLLGAMTAVGFTSQLTLTRLPGILARTGPMMGDAMTEATKGALRATLVFVSAGLGQYLAGVLSDRRDERKLYVGFLGLSVVPLLLLGALEGWPMVVAACFAFAFIFGVQPLENTVLGRFSEKRSRSIIYGWKFVLVFGVGGYLGARAAGWIERGWGLSWIPPVAAATAVLAGLLALCASRVRAAPAGLPAPALAGPLAAPHEAGITRAPTARRSPPTG